MAKVLDPRVPVRFVPGDQLKRPESQQIAYLLRPPKLYDDAALDRATVAHGGRQHNSIERLQVLKQGIVATFEEADAADRDFFAGKVDQYIEELVAIGEQQMAGGFDTSTEEGQAEQLEYVQRIADFEEALRPIVSIVQDRYDRFAQICADDEVYPNIRGTEAARLFLVGWENRPTPFLRGPMGVSDDLLMTIPARHRIAIGNRVEQMLRPTEAEAKNSDSPSASPSGPKTSPAASTPRQTRPSKTTSGL